MGFRPSWDAPDAILDLFKVQFLRPQPPKRDQSGVIFGSICVMSAPFWWIAFGGSLKREWLKGEIRHRWGCGFLGG